MKTDFTYYYLITLLGWSKKARGVPEERDIFAPHDASQLQCWPSTPVSGMATLIQSLCTEVLHFVKVGYFDFMLFRFVMIKSNLCLMTSYQILQNGFDRISLISRRSKKNKDHWHGSCLAKSHSVEGAFSCPEQMMPLAWEGPLSAQTTQPLNKYELCLPELSIQILKQFLILPHVSRPHSLQWRIPACSSAVVQMPNVKQDIAPLTESLLKSER